MAEKPAAEPAGPGGPPDQTTISAGLLKIFGLGTLILGDSGIGKSESAVELISRGHQFVADDVVQIRVAPKGGLIGTAPALSRNFMEIRGLGIINIRAIFGSRALAREAKVDLVIRLKKWRRGYEADRLGLKSGDDMTILGRNIPQLAIPVAPGRNIATLIEIACKVHILRQKGYSAPDEIIRRLDRVLT
jgi:HPr kinase/phosphorylase